MQRGMAERVMQLRNKRRVELQLRIQRRIATKNMARMKRTNHINVKQRKLKEREQVEKQTIDNNVKLEDT